MKYINDLNINIILGRASPSYIINDESIAIVDVCFPSDAKNILDFIKYALKRNINDIKLIVLTHSHLDHINGVDYLCNKTGAEIAAHSNAEKYLTGQRALPIPEKDKVSRFLTFWLKNGLPRPSFLDVFNMPWAGVPGIKKRIKSKVTHWLMEDVSLPYHPEWKVIHTPGHTDDSICLYNSQCKSLISGDTIINLKNQPILNPLLVLDQEALFTSLKKLQQKEIDALYPGWGTPIIKKDLIKDIS